MDQSSEASDTLRDVSAPTPSNDHTSREIDMIPLKHYFSMESHDFSKDTKLDFIMQWASEKGLTNKPDLLLELKKLEIKLGAPNAGESRIDRLYHYLRLDQQLGSTLKEMSSYERSSDAVK